MLRHPIISAPSIDVTPDISVLHNWSSLRDALLGQVMSYHGERTATLRPSKYCVLIRLAYFAAFTNGHETSKAHTQ